MKKYTHISYEERVLIRHYQVEGHSLSQMARYLGWSKSTVHRELARNSNRDGYNPKTANRRYQVRRQKFCKLDKDPELKAYVLKSLYEGISPEMISLRLMKFGQWENIPTISHETICRSLYRPPQKKAL